MTDVSSTIIVGKWALQESAGIVVINDGEGWLALHDYEARDLAAALQVWIDKTTETVI